MANSDGHVMTAPTARLSRMVGDYLAVRRSLGFKLKEPERVLTGFVDFLLERELDQVTVQAAVAFATALYGGTARSQALRLSAVRGFARWAKTVDDTVEVPPDRLLPARSTRAAPYIYTARSKPCSRPCASG